MKGKLFLIPSPLGETDFSQIFPTYNSEIIQEIDYYIVENLRTGRRFLKKLGISKPIDSLHFFELNEHTKQSEIEEFIKPCLEGHNVGLLSDAGTPCVADPGNIVVSRAQREEVEVVPLVGPNSILLALMASGLNGQCFAFNGYLPVDQYSREKELRFYESIYRKNGQTQIFIETPYRNNHFLNSILSVCGHDLKVCVACNVSTPEQFIKTQTVAKWKKSNIDLHKKPTVFLIGGEKRTH